MTGTARRDILPLAVGKNTQPLFQVQQRPDQKPPILLAVKVILYQFLHCASVYVFVQVDVFSKQLAANVIDAIPFEPAGIRGGK